MQTIEEYKEYTKQLEGEVMCEYCDENKTEKQKEQKQAPNP